MDCYDEILKCYKDRNLNSQLITIWYSRYITTLLEKLNQTQDKTLDKLVLKNCLILILNLFLIENPDHLHEIGKPFKNLDENERKVFLKILESELKN